MKSMGAPYIASYYFSSNLHLNYTILFALCQAFCEEYSYTTKPENLFSKIQKTFKKPIDKSLGLWYNIYVVKSNMREWRNWQTRTFEGRVDSPYGFKSRFSHQRHLRKWVLFFFLLTIRVIYGIIIIA